MPSHSNSRTSRDAAPSAPPLHLMEDSSFERDYRTWGPPPRYEEAIADETAPADHTNATHPASRLPEPTSQSDRNAPQNRPESRRSHRTRQVSDSPSSDRHRSTLHRSAAGSLSSQTSATSPRHRGRNNRYRSASPGQISDGARDDGSQERSSSSGDCNQNNKKRSSGSKIKKGLENIAFFIIQVLD